MPVRTSMHCAAAILVACVSAVAAPNRLPDEMHALAQASIRHVYHEEFKQAQTVAKRLIKDYPDHPAGYFFMAAVLDAQMENRQSEEDEIEFYRYCDLTIQKGEEFLERTPNDPWAKFFIGGANGARGMYESRYGRWITAFRYGWQGVTALKEAYGLTPSLKDALMGVATYDYWRSAMTKMLWWMPGVEDKRVEAIRVLYAVVDSSVYVQEAAGKHLGFALNNEKRYGEGLTVANKLLARYPGYLVFQWMAIDAYMGLKKYEEAERLLKLVLQRVEMQRVENHYNEIQCHYKLALIYLEQNRYSLCLYECSRISELPTDDATRKRLEDQFSSVEQIRKNAMSGSRSEKQKFMK